MTVEQKRRAARDREIAKLMNGLREMGFTLNGNNYNGEETPTWSQRLPGQYGEVRLQVYETGVSISTPPLTGWNLMGRVAPAFEYASLTADETLAVVEDLINHKVINVPRS